MAAASLRVLHVLEATLGGTRRYLEDIAVSTNGLEIAHGLVYGTSRSDSGFAAFLELARRAGWFLRPAGPLRRPVRPLQDARSVSIVARAIREFKPAIVHVHSAKAGAAGRIAALATWPSSPKIVYSPHALPVTMGAPFMAIEAALARLTDRFVAVSDSERREIVSSGLAKIERVDVVYPRIDTATFVPSDRHAARAQLNLPNVPIVLGIGRLATQKDPVSFVEILARVRESQPQAIGIWVGDGELRNEVEQLARRLRLGDGFQVTGWTNDVRPYIAAADLLLSTSRYESFGYVVPETFAMERPVVASRVTGTIDVFFPGADAMLYSLEDDVAAAEAISKLIGNRILAMEMGRLGRLSVIERFSTPSMRAALATSYRAALS